MLHQVKHRFTHQEETLSNEELPPYDQLKELKLAFNFSEARVCLISEKKGAHGKALYLGHKFKEQEVDSTKLPAVAASQSPSTFMSRSVCWLQSPCRETRGCDKNDLTCYCAVTHRKLWTSS